MLVSYKNGTRATYYARVLWNEPLAEPSPNAIAVVSGERRVTAWGGVELYETPNGPSIIVDYIAPTPTRVPKVRLAANGVLKVRVADHPSTIAISYSRRVNAWPPSGRLRMSRHRVCGVTLFSAVVPRRWRREGSARIEVTHRRDGLKSAAFGIVRWGR